MINQSIEQDIADKGMTAPRIMMADIEANISKAFYFTAAQGAEKAARDNGSYAAGEPHEGVSLGLLTFCVLVLRNGFTVTGESACASPENFDEEIGRKIARQNAIGKVWPLMGYELRTALSDPRLKVMLELRSQESDVKGTHLKPHQQRVVKEKAELDDKLDKLNAFLKSAEFNNLDRDEQTRLQRQCLAMLSYSAVLNDRITAFG